MKLDAWLKIEGNSARDLALRAETTEATISRLKNGRVQPSLELAARIAEATGGMVTPNDFIETSQPDRASGESLEGASVLLVIAGGIAAYKALELIRRLKERGASLRVVITRAGSEFVTPLSVGALTGEPPFTDLFDQRAEMDVGHIRLAREADAIVVAPATADLMAKMAHGHADDLATAVLLATGAPVLVAPAMNPHMWANPATQRNLVRLLGDGISTVGPNAGEMAESGEAGIGRMAEVPEIVAALERLLARPSGQPLAGKRVVVTSGPTHEPIDPVRYIANRSSGKQGHAIAAAAARLGAEVTLVSGPVALPDPPGVTTVHVESARDMLQAVEGALPADVGIFAAAVADWRMPETAPEKMKKAGPAQEMDLRLVQNPDILKMVSRGHKRPALVVGFAAETENVVDHARAKRQSKGCDWIVANDVSHETGIMGGDRNTVHLVSASDVEDWPDMPKEAVAEQLMQRVADYFAQAGEKAE